MSLVSYLDANRFLDQTKISFTDDDDVKPEAEIADSMVHSSLDTMFDEAPTWDANPDTDVGQTLTPVLVRTVTSMIMAALRYAKVYSEESQTPNSYASNLMTRADMLLRGIQDGTYSLTEVIIPSTSDISRNDFWPNNNDVITEDNPQIGFDTGDPDRKFSLDRVF